MLQEITAMRVYNVEVDAWTKEDIALHEEDEWYYPDTYCAVIGGKKSEIIEEMKKRFFTDDIVKLDISMVKVIESNYVNDHDFKSIIRCETKHIEK